MTELFRRVNFSADLTCYICANVQPNKQTTIQSVNQTEFSLLGLYSG